MSQERNLLKLMMVDKVPHVSRHRLIIMNLPVHRIPMISRVQRIHCIPQLIQLPTPISPSLRLDPNPQNSLRHRLEVIL
jgi:hypothetical protein